ncbi:MAG: helix-turn-helix domain-containing protein, partial [bacterium]
HHFLPGLNQRYYLITNLPGVSFDCHYDLLMYRLIVFHNVSNIRGTGQFPEITKYAQVEVEKLGKEWEKVGEEFWTELDHYLPEARKMHGKIQVDVGKMGTIASGYWSTKHYYLRSDRSIGDLAAMIVNNTLMPLREQLGVTWSKREALMDFIMTRPVMRKLFPDFAPVFRQLLQIEPIIRHESEEYVRNLGIVVPQKELELRRGKIFIKNVIVDKAMGKKEKIILKKLMEKFGELVSYDELADAVWGEGEFKSFWALAKLVERMRVALQKMGVDPKRVRSVRGQGYLLK